MVTQKIPAKKKNKAKPLKNVERPKTFFAILDEFSKNVPTEQLARHPEDGARYLDHYLYGIPKEEIE